MNHTRQVVRMITAALTCFLCGAGIVYFAVPHQHGSTGAAAQNKKTGTPRLPALVRVLPAEKKNIHTVRPFHGKLTEIQLASISTEVSGIIVDLPIEIGQKVKGSETLIAQIDKTFIELSAADADAEVKILEKQYAHQQAELARIEQLAASSATTASEISNQRMLAEQYRQGLEKAKIAQREAIEKLKRTTILAPFDGYVVRRATDKGELLAVGTTIADIVSLGQIDATVNISEEFINHVNIDDDMPVIIDQLGLKVNGKVHAIVPYDITTTRSFPVIVRMSDRDGELKSGMSATALVAITDPREEFVVSKDAVLEKPDGNTVWIAVEGEKITAQPVPVRIVAENVSEYGVIPETDDGKKILLAGAKTIIEGAEKLTANQHIRIAELAPKLLIDLPPASGHKVLEKSF